MAVFVTLGVPHVRLVGGSGALVGETKCCAGFLTRGDPVKDFAKWRAVADAGHCMLVFFWGEQCLQLGTANSTAEAKRTGVLVEIHRVFCWDDRHPVGRGYTTAAEAAARKYIGSQHAAMVKVEDVFRQTLQVPKLRLFSGLSRPNANADHLPPAAMRVITFGFASGGIADANGRYWPFAPVSPEGVVGPAAVVAGPLGSLEPTLAPLDGKLRNAWSTFRQPSLGRDDVQRLRDQALGRPEALLFNMKAEDVLDEEAADEVSPHSLYEASFCRSTFIIFIKHVTHRI